MLIRSQRELFGKVRAHARDCQRCGQPFQTRRIVPYCPSCYRVKHGGRS